MLRCLQWNFSIILIHFFVLKFRHLGSCINNISDNIYLFNKDSKAFSKPIWRIVFLDHEIKQKFLDWPSLVTFCGRFTQNKQFTMGCLAWKYEAFPVRRNKNTGYLTRTGIVILKQITMSKTFTFTNIFTFNFKQMRKNSLLLRIKEISKNRILTKILLKRINMISRELKWHIFFRNCCKTEQNCWQCRNVDTSKNSLHKMP